VRPWCNIGLSGLLLLGASLRVIGAEPKRVLFVHSLGRDFAPYNTFSSVLRTELASQLPQAVDIYEVSLESARFEDSGGEGSLMDYVRAQFASRRLDLVVPIGGAATRFAQRHRTRLFPATPMLIAGTDQRHLNAASLTTNDAVVAVANNPTRTLETILHVLPQTTQVVVATGNSPLEQFWVGELRRELQSFSNRVDFVWLNELPFSEMLQRCAARRHGRSSIARCCAWMPPACRTWRSARWPNSTGWPTRRSSASRTRKWAGASWAVR
jgi:hypothetical protein